MSAPKHTAGLDTTGFVQRWVPAHGDRQGYAGPARMPWSDLSPFTQGYIEALLTALMVPGPDGPEPLLFPAFSDLAPETLARIITDCEAFARDYPGWDHRDGGGLFWASRQGGSTGWPAYMSEGFPPLSVQLGDDGKVRFAKATGETGQ